MSVSQSERGLRIITALRGTRAIGRSRGIASVRWVAPALSQGPALSSRGQPRHTGVSCPDCSRCIAVVGLTSIHRPVTRQLSACPRFQGSDSLPSCRALRPSFRGLTSAAFSAVIDETVEPCRRRRDLAYGRRDSVIRTRNARQPHRTEVLNPSRRPRIEDTVVDEMKATGPVESTI